MRREASSCGNNVGVQSKGLLRPWAEMPMEEKVHVQGIPGGDLTLFSGLPSVFSPQLWKCAGYVPKKFSFQYMEFPYWDDDKKENTGANIDEDKENSADRGASVLFSLSKENLKVNPVGSLFGIGGRDEELKYERKGHLRECKKWEAVGVDVLHSQNFVKKNRSLLRPIVIHTRKRKKEEPSVLKGSAGKKRARIGDSDVDEQRRTLQTSRTAFTTTSDAKRLELCENSGPKSFKIDIQSVKNRNLRDSVPSGSLSCGHVDSGVSESLGKPVDAAGVIRLKGSFSAKNEAHQQNLSAIDETKVVSSSHQHPEPAIIQKAKLGESVSSKKPDGSTSERDRKATEECPASPCHKIAVDSTGPDVNSNNPPVMLQHNVKMEVGANDVKRVDDILSSFQASGKPIQSTNCAEVGTNAAKMSENLDNTDVDGSCLVSGDIKSSGTALSMEPVTECRVNTVDELSGVLCEQKQEAEGSEGYVAAQEKVCKGAFVSDKELAKFVAAVPSALKSEQKSVVCEGVISSQQNLTVTTTQLDSGKSLNSENNHSVMNIPATTSCCQTAKVEQATGNFAGNDGRHDGLRRSEKDQSLTPLASTILPSCRFFNTPFSKRTGSNTKDFDATSSSKSSSSQNVTISSASGDSAGTMQNQSSSHAQSKVTPSGLPQRGGKYHAFPLPPSSKTNNSTIGHLPTVSNPSATLSDEELSLLLHQELNSSPRVPHVPRVRHAGSFPQLASQAVPSLLIKRTSSSGSKDQNLLPRRKTEDMLKYGSHSTREFDVEAKKAARVISSPDQQKQVRVHREDCTRRDTNGSTDSSKRNFHSLRTSRSSGPSSSNEANNNKFSSSHRSREIDSDDDGSETTRNQVHRTLPELVNEIMSKGKHMTCEELCNAVLPHWHNLRKHNGKRYAYSSPSHAVFDCLRNRPDWARLVDRSPKTVSVKKRRKLDMVDSDDEQDTKPGTAREVENRSLESQHDEFPKGKCKARKRRRLALQGRGVNDLRNRQKTTRFDDEGTSYESSEETVFSEDDGEEGTGGGSARNPASSSSDATGGS